MKTLFKLKCPHCGEKQYESAKSRIRNGTFSVIVILLFILPISLFFDLPIGAAFALGLLIALIILCAYPFVLKLSSEEEPYW